MKKTVEEIANHLNGKIIGNKGLTISGVTNVLQPMENFITFITDEKQLKLLEKSDISCIIVPNSVTESTKTLISCPNPKLGFAQTLQLFYPKKPGTGKHASSAYVAESAKIGQNVTIEDFVFIEDDCIVGDNAILKSGVFLGRSAQIGTDTTLYPHVVVYPNSKIGNQVIIHANSVIGADGFGYVHSGIEQIKVPQVGNVIIEDQVEIGACTMIDRATLGSTIIRKGVKIDNQVQIGHNVEIGENTVLSSFVGISGSCKIGKNCVLGGQVGFGDHCEIGNQVMIGAQAGVPSGKKVPDNQILLGSPARPIHHTKKQMAAQTLLPGLLKKFSELEAKVKKLEAEKN